MKYVTKKGDKFWPSSEMKKTAWLTDEKIYQQADKNPVDFWEKLAEEGITWGKKWSKAYEEKLPYFKWFKGGKLNASVNCLDRHLATKKDKTAITWIPEPINQKTIKLTYQELYEKVNKTANL